jgi:hypothetical protein
MDEYLIVIAACVGVGIGAVLPFYLKNQSISTWNHYYTLSALGAAVTAILTVWADVRAFAALGPESIVYAAAWGFSLTWGANKLIMKPTIKKLKKKPGA